MWALRDLVIVWLSAVASTLGKSRLSGKRCLLGTAGDLLSCRHLAYACACASCLQVVLCSLQALLVSGPSLRCVPALRCQQDMESANVACETGLVASVMFDKELKFMDLKFMDLNRNWIMSSWNLMRGSRHNL